MIPNVAKRGTSFKGAAKYLLHDKRESGEIERFTDERVAWTENRNLMTNDPNLGVNIMAYTAMEKERLKAAAGIKATGRKSRGDVYHYSLAWSPEEQGNISREDMLKAVDETLAALGANDHQAVIIAHNDEPHPHVHVLLNLVHPQTGKNLGLSHDYKKLDKWAYEYRKQQGKEYLFCPDRTKKHEEIAKKKAGLKADFVRGSKNIRTSLHGDFEQVRQNANDNAYKEAVKHYQKTNDSPLYQKGLNLRARHKSEWAALSKEYQDNKNKLKQRHKAKQKAAKDAAFKLYKPLFTAAYREQYKDRKAFEEKERTFFGRMHNALKAYDIMQTMDDKQRPDVLSTLFSAYAERKDILALRHDREIARLKAHQSAHLREEHKKLGEQLYKAKGAEYQRFLTARTALIDKHKAEKLAHREEWQKANGKQRSQCKVIQLKDHIKSADDRYYKQPENREYLKPDKVAQDFDKAQEKPKRKRKKRTRKKKREE